MKRTLFLFAVGLIFRCCVAADLHAGDGPRNAFVACAYPVADPRDFTLPHSSRGYNAWRFEGGVCWLVRPTPGTERPAAL